MRKMLFVVVLVLVPLSLFAQDRDRDRDSRYRRHDSRPNNFELTPFAGYRWGGTIYADRTDLFGQDVDVASSAAYGLNLAIPIGSTPLKLELMANRQNSHLSLGGGLFEPSGRLADMDISYYHAGVQIPFAASRNATPFVVVSAGIANLDPQIAGVSADNRFSASAGVGIKLPVTENLGFRFEARGYVTSLGNDDRDYCYYCDNNGNDRNFYQGETNIGVVFSF